MHCVAVRNPWVTERGVYMSERGRITAAVLLHSARTLAGYAASELLAARPLGDAPRSGDFRRWKNLFVQMLEELAAALDVRRFTFFVEHVAWLQRLLESRGIEPGSLRAALGVLAGVLETELGDEAGPAAEWCRRAAGELERLAEKLQPAAPPGDARLSRLAVEYLVPLLEGDRARAARVVLDALGSGVAVEDLYQRVLLPAQEELGRMWQADEINVAEEHFATATTKAIMAQLRAAAPTRSPRGKTVVAAAVAGNRHDVGLQAVADFFDMDGWRAIQLGADVPTGDLIEAIADYQADLLALSVAQRTQLATLRATIEVVRRGPSASIKILVGGRALAGAADLATEFGADGCAAGPAEAVALGNRLVGIEPAGALC